MYRIRDIMRGIEGIIHIENIIHLLVSFLMKKSTTVLYEFIVLKRYSRNALKVQYERVL